MPSGKDKQQQVNGASSEDNRPEKRSKDDNLGRALKSVYDDTLREDVPNEFKDLLGKLG